MPTFLNASRPLLTTIISVHEPEQAREYIRMALEDNTDAFGIYWQEILPKYRTKEAMREVFGWMGGKPIYITDYIRGSVMPEQTEEERAEELLMSLECGATLLDIRGDMFDPTDGEFTTDPTAIRRQKELIRQIHALGGEVLMSTHALRYLPADRVLEIAQAQQERGADIAKVVTDANSQEELDDNFMISVRLHQTLHIPTLFLCNGTHCALHRRVAPMLNPGAPFLCKQERNPDAPGSQPTLPQGKAILRAMGYDIA